MSDARTQRGLQITESSVWMCNPCRGSSSEVTEHSKGNKTTPEQSSPDTWRHRRVSTSAVRLHSGHRAEVLPQPPLFLHLGPLPGIKKLRAQDPLWHWLVDFTPNMRSAWLAPLIALLSASRGWRAGDQLCPTGQAFLLASSKARGSCAMEMWHRPVTLLLGLCKHSHESVLS